MTIGITGHQDLQGPETIAWLKKSIEQELLLLMVERAYSCLAIGADQLFAEIIIKAHIPLTAVIPSENYSATFNSESQEIFADFLTQASEIIQLKYSTPSGTAFFAAGKKIVESADLIFALWNGQHAKGLGGTGDVVNYALEKKKRIIHLNIVTKSIIYLNFI